MFKFLGRGLSLSVLITAILLTFTIIVFLMAVVLAGEGPVKHTIACQLNLAEDCVQRRLMEERGRLQELQRQHRRLEARNTELEALLQRLASLDHASSSYVVFYKNTKGRHTVTTGHTFKSLVDPNTLIGAHCYFHVDMPGAGNREIRLGTMSARKRVTASRYSRSDLRGTGLSQNDIGSHFARCQWPEGAR